MNGNFNAVVYSEKSTKHVRKTTDLCSIELDRKNYSEPENLIQIAAGEFITDGNEIRNKYKYFDNHKITVYQNNKRIFEGTFEELCAKIQVIQ